MSKVFYLSLIFLFFSAVCFAQNLVPNPSFEEYDTCPNSYSQFEYATGWWSVRPTPDYYNECGTGLAGMPYNGAGFQEADSGSAYSGIIIFNVSGNYMNEIIATELTIKMKTGFYYKVGFSTNRADGLVHRRLACNNLGVLFSTLRYDLQSTFPVFDFSHFKIDSIITDTLNWLHVEFEFQADSDYQYIMIGNFYSNELTDTINYMHGPSKAYYYIDNVYVIEDSSNAINQLLSKQVNSYYSEADKLVIENAKGNSIKIIDVDGSTVLDNESIESDSYVIDLLFPFMIIVIITTLATVIYIKKHINPKT